MTRPLDAAPHWQRIAQAAVDGHEAQQDPAELAALLQALASRQLPQTVIEVGGGTGGSAWAWLQLPTVTEVITVTTPVPGRQWTCDCQPAQHWLELGSSTDGDTLHKVRQHLMGRVPGFAWIDGNHSARVCWADIRTWGLAWGDQCLVGVHDIGPQVNWLDFGVPEVWASLQTGRRTAELFGPGDHPPGTGLILPDLITWGDFDAS